jgi:hypothetical protein
MVLRMVRYSAVFLLCATLIGVTGASATYADDAEGLWTTSTSYHYNPDYLFAITRELRRNSSGSPGVSAVLAPVTFAADIALLPFSLVLGFMG